MDTLKLQEQKKWVSLVVKAIEDYQQSYTQNLSQGPNPRFYAYQILKELVYEQLPQEEQLYEKNINNTTR
jgi:hypothetical protein